MIVGVLGAGQLGRMLALAGYPLGLRFRFLDSALSSPVEQLADVLVGDLEDLEVLRRFTANLNFVTYEFENVPLRSVQFLAQHVSVFPPPKALEAAQDRLHEKNLFQRLGIPSPAFMPVDSENNLNRGLDKVGLPAVLKTNRMGYDGKGQYVLRSPADADPAWRLLGRVPLLLEQFVPFEREVSILAVKGRQGEVAFYPLVENKHEGGILRYSLAPAPETTAELQSLAEGYALRILEELDYVGVLAIEFFQYAGRLLANEMAPRVHNSGHWTIEGADTSQFENHLRAILGLPLGSTAPIGCSAMVNLIGKVPDLETVFRTPDIHLHLYGKAPRDGRKLGHVTLRSTDAATQMARLGELLALAKL